MLCYFIGLWGQVQKCEGGRVRVTVMMTVG